ncbi:MAG: hypothetical protein L0215_14585, partial [Gemmataceae bacterium]|nr:hypothetical protein [Gemmataceae bacterium]
MLFLFALTLFVSATLLFLVQPMIGKMVLPRLGGTPGVWNTCMVFFQAVLLVGYGYTHSVSYFHKRRRQLVLQFAILVLPFLVLPFSLGAWNPPVEHNPVLAVLWLLLGVVGLPFFVVSTTAPLLQKWFSATGHPAAKDPYFLYGASNLGSMLALLLYPVLIEPYFDLDSQTWLWTIGYAAFVILVAVCGLSVWKEVPALTPSPSPTGRGENVGPVTATPSPQRKVEKPASTAVTPAKRVQRHRALAAADSPLVKQDAALHPLTWGRRLRWIGLAAAPSSLMLGVTTYLTTDIAAIPFIWIIPLALYLLTFILVFLRWPVPWTDMPHTVMLYIQPCILMVLILVLTTTMERLSIWLIFIIHILAYFATALVCHGELAKDRPASRHLTEFYLCMSIGGVAGGLFNTLVAPTFFWFGVVEYYLAMVLACALRPSLVGQTPLIPGDSYEGRPTIQGWLLDFLMPALLGATSYLAVQWATEPGSTTTRNYLMATMMIIVLALAGRPLRFALALGCVLGGVKIAERLQSEKSGSHLVFEGRSFFGFVKVREQLAHDKLYHTLVHGVIDHGSQIVEPASMRRDPITYFHPTNG